MAHNLEAHGLYAPKMHFEIGSTEHTVALQLERCENPQVSCLSLFPVSCFSKPVYPKIGRLRDVSIALVARAH